MKCFLFDCDGVLLNSNSVKTQAFYQATLPYGKDAAQAMVDYHTANGGISRYKKLAHFCDSISPQFPSTTLKPDLNSLLVNYAEKVREGLLACEVAEGLFELRELTAGTPWMIVSGGDQAELREVFAKRGLDHLFDAGIFGSPDTKDEILARELASGNIKKPALFLGDSKYDYEAATRAGLDFVFVSQWSEVKDWQAWVEQEGIETVSSIKQLTTRFS
ncbi:haloacid dehalogenase superfamily, subfamily IA, variant 1 with third motif having Dx(3-4)D or Dx(3-4)E [Marinospirillum celere]|uniref:phosphoglycolate phosphatase n=1 Tax=Marinospirillum celere TaxID=1122252 RepID=A0A1I1GR48_9GAMM|nr:HAD-IA family hydrolase [Marinospirillum celere]SFC14247.1 haloacid dehalogenase superfamily, subfamily IA, variant 1 with third motif having Dx(3-4)D or Dx(3-4)E [Marinospirillum celere]